MGERNENLGKLHPLQATPIVTTLSQAILAKKARKRASGGGSLWDWWYVGGSLITPPCLFTAWGLIPVIVGKVSDLQHSSKQ